MNNKKRDNKDRLLFMEETQEKSGRYRYSYVDALGKRKEVYSWRLTEAEPMRTKQKMITTWFSDKGYFTTKEV